MSSVSLILTMVRSYSAFGTLDILKEFNCKGKGMVSENTRLWPWMNKNVYGGHHGCTVRIWSLFESWSQPFVVVVTFESFRTLRTDCNTRFVKIVLLPL